MSKLLIGVAMLAALYTPAKAQMGTDLDTIVGIYMAMTYDADCKSGSLAQDTRDFLKLWLARASRSTRQQAETKVTGWQDSFGTEIFCRMADKIIAPKLDDFNKNATKIMGIVR